MCTTIPWRTDKNLQFETNDHPKAGGARNCPCGWSLGGRRRPATRTGLPLKGGDLHQLSRRGRHCVRDSKQCDPAGAAYTVAIAVTGGSGNIGYWISGNGASVNGISASATMTAPAAAGTYTYTAWVRQGLTASTTYSITVGPVATTPPPTTVPRRLSRRPRCRRPRSRRRPPVGWVQQCAGQESHLSMYNGFGATCAACHNGISQPKAPRISISGIDMKPCKDCSKCHFAHEGHLQPMQ